MTSPQAVLEALYDESPEAVEAALDVPAEGQEVQIAYKGPVVDILHRIAGHLRSSVSYGGAESLEAIRARVVQAPMRYLVQLSEAARRESYER
jgi:IMP dehydrogenase/GMP reductase